MPSRREGPIGEIIRSFRKIKRAIDRFSAEFRDKYNITGPQAGALKIIAQEGPLSLTEVSHRSFRHITTVGGIVDRLERDGYVARRRDNGDRRRVVLEATPMGRRLAGSAPFAGPLRAIQALEKLPTKQLLKIRDSMTILVRILGEEAEAPQPGTVRARPPRSGMR